MSQSNTTVYFYGLLPQHVQRALWDYAERKEESPRRLRREIISGYLNQLKDGMVPRTNRYDAMSLKRDLNLVPLLLDLPEDVASELASFCNETGVAKEAITTLAIDQFLRANGIERREEHK